MLVSRGGYGSTLSPVSLYAPFTKEEEADTWLKREAEAIKAELNEVEARIRDLETSK